MQTDNYLTSKNICICNNVNANILTTVAKSDCTFLPMSPGCRKARETCFFKREEFQGGVVGSFTMFTVIRLQRRNLTTSWWTSPLLVAQYVKKNKTKKTLHETILFYLLITQRVNIASLFFLRWAAGVCHGICLRHRGGFRYWSLMKTKYVQIQQYLFKKVVKHLTRGP